MRLGEEARDRGRHNRPDVGHLLQRPRVRRHQRVETTEMARQILGRRLADVADAQGIDEARQRRLLAGVDRGEQVCRRFLGHAFEIRHRRHAQPIEIGRRPDDIVVDELVDDLLAQALDVHGPA